MGKKNKKDDVIEIDIDKAGEILESFNKALQDGSIKLGTNVKTTGAQTGSILNTHPEQKEQAPQPGLPSAPAGLPQVAQPGLSSTPAVQPQVAQPQAISQAQQEAIQDLIKNWAYFNDDKERREECNKSGLDFEKVKAMVPKELLGNKPASGPRLPSGSAGLPSGPATQSGVVGELKERFQGGAPASMPPPAMPGVPQAAGLAAITSQDPKCFVSNLALFIEDTYSLFTLFDIVRYFTEDQGTENTGLKNDKSLLAGTTPEIKGLTRVLAAIAVKKYAQSFGLNDNEKETIVNVIANAAGFRETLINTLERLGFYDKSADVYANIKTIVVDSLSNKLTGNTIIDNFRRYLEKNESLIELFKENPANEGTANTLKTILSKYPDIKELVKHKEQLITSLGTKYKHIIDLIKTSLQ